MTEYEGCCCGCSSNLLEILNSFLAPLERIRAIQPQRIVKKSILVIMAAPPSLHLLFPSPFNLNLDLEKAPVLLTQVAL